MKLIKRLAVSLALFGAFFVGSSGMIVANASTASAANCNEGSFFLPRWYDGLCQDGKIQSPGAGKSTKGTQMNLGTFVTKIAINIVTIMLTIVGYVSLAFIIWGGFKYMISGDSSNGTSAAKKTILNAIIGLILSIMSVAIVRVIAGAIG